MGAEQSTVKRHGYVLVKETQNAVVATKEDDTFLIKKISRNATAALTPDIEVLKTINHPHAVSYKNSFTDKRDYYVVMNYCKGGSLAAKIRESDPLEESEVLSYFVEICLALKTFHENELVHRRLTTENIFLTEFGTVCLGEFGNIHESTKTVQSLNDTDWLKALPYQAPEVITHDSGDAKSDIWSLGCILFELCTQQKAFTAETQRKLIPKILGGPCPTIPVNFSPELCDLYNKILEKDPQSRPTVNEILGRDIFVKCLLQKSKTTVKELQTMLKNLRGVADGLERVHEGTTIGSLAGGVIGAAGGITSIVGLILAPFTLGASLIVTGVGVGVGTLGGLAAGASNITNVVNQSSDRKTVRSIIRAFEQKMNAVVTWLLEITGILHRAETTCGSSDTESGKFNEKDFLRFGSRAGRGLGGIAELVRLIKVMSIGRIAAQTARVVRVAEVATGVLSALFVAVDIFFIAMDAKEIHHIREARAAEGGGATNPDSVPMTDTYNFGDQSALMQECTPDETETQTPIRSEIMKFVRSIRVAADNLQKVLDELNGFLSSVTLEERNTE